MCKLGNLYILFAHLQTYKVTNLQIAYEVCNDYIQSSQHRACGVYA